MQQDDRQAALYSELSRRLDAIPNGFPATESGVELRLLAKLYTPEQALLAAHLELDLQSADTVAAQAGCPLPETVAVLKDMARLGLIRSRQMDGRPAFGLMPFMVGVYEAQLSRMDGELARLFEEYLQEGFASGALGTTPALHRIVPVEQSIALDVAVFPYEQASQMLDGALSFGVRDCVCRVQKAFLDQRCIYPIENCVVFHPAEAAFDRSRTIRPISKEAALLVLRQASELGLVHSSANVQRGHGYICNCCTCCCAILRGLVEFGSAMAVAGAAFYATVDESICLGCHSCQDACPFGAVSMMVGKAQIDRGRCMGCGLCTVNCPADAVSLSRDPSGTAQPPPSDEDAWLRERATNRQLRHS